jgi:hypothetical protein
VSNYVRERTNQAAKLSIEGAIIQNVGGLYRNKLAKRSGNQKSRSTQHYPRLSAVQEKLEENKSSLPTCRSNLLMIHKCPATDREKVRGLLCRRLVRTKQVPRCVDRGKGREILYRRALQNRLP